MKNRVGHRKPNLKSAWILLLPAAVALFLLSCAPGNTTQKVESAKGGKSPTTQRTAHEMQATYDQFFAPNKTQLVLRQEREEFLIRERITNIPRGRRFESGIGYCGFNTPSVPLIGQYEGVAKGGVMPGLHHGLKFSDAFFGNIPEEVKRALAQFDIQTLDLFLMIQEGMTFLKSTDRVQLITHPWAMPDMPATFSGTIFNRQIQMGIYASDHDISKDIQVGQIRPFSVIIHDNAFSPKTAQLNIKWEALDMAFWSVVVDAEKKRGAATLHLLIAQEYISQVDFFNHHTLEDLFQKLPLQPKGSLRNKLEELIRLD